VAPAWRRAAAAPAESDGSDDEDRMDDMIADIGMEYDLGSGDQHPPLQVQNFYRLLVALDEKMHDGTELTVLLGVMHLMGMKSKYNFSNQCYNNIVKLIIHLIPAKHNMHAKRLLPVKEDCCWSWYELHVILEGAQGRY
jgi:hypothetical protein